jgi:hypothetical protein
MLRDLQRALLAAGMILALSGLALAHDENSRGFDAAQRGYDQGYRDGFNHGREDRDRRSDYDYQSDDYRRADRGYDRDSGDREQFASGYREGYNGRNQRSDDAHDRGRYGHDNRHEPRGDGYRDAAHDTGYRDGIEGAQKDIRKNKRFDFNDHDWYRDADHGYSSDYGDKESYRRSYRQGYEAGYRDTFDPAYATGYRDGIVGARKDLRRRKSPDPTRHEWYQDANRGYGGDHDRGRENYRQRYREGYAAGYNDAYSGQGY